MKILKILFRDNNSTNEGGGMYLEDVSVSILFNVTFKNNYAQSGGGALLKAVQR